MVVIYGQFSCAISDACSLFNFAVVNNYNTYFIVLLLIIIFILFYPHICESQRLVEKTLFFLEATTFLVVCNGAGILFAFFLLAES